MGNSKQTGTGLAAIIAIGVLSIYVQSAGFVQEHSQVVATRSGKLNGTAEDGIAAFKGIPYAAPPVGALRWKAPQPPISWDGIRPAKEYGPPCVQYDAKDGWLKGSGEDCLTLNVFTKKPEAGAKMPVMVWIHGGGWRVGFSSRYDGKNFAARDVVLVTINYRLGYIGFFNSPSLEREEPGRPMNLGMLDVVAALRWVKDNIDNFGGDPGNVTIFGESAGGGIVVDLMTSPPARGLFHKVICQSGPIWIRKPSRAEMLVIGDVVAMQVGLLKSGPIPFATGDELRAIPAEKFAQIAPMLNSPAAPVFGDMVLPEQPVSAFFRGRQSPIPLLIGTNDWEAGMIMSGQGQTTQGQFLSLGDAVRKVRDLYAGSLNDDRMAQDISTDENFAAPSRWTARRQARLAGTYEYQFTYIPPPTREKVPGADHASEVGLLFGLDRPAIGVMLSDPENQKMSKTLQEVWVSFARSGKPSAADLPGWKAIDGKNDYTMILGRQPNLEVDYHRARMDFHIQRFEKASLKK